jgi:hypothetical protein
MKVHRGCPKGGGGGEEILARVWGRMWSLRARRESYFSAAKENESDYNRDDKTGNPEKSFAHLKVTDSYLIYLLNHTIIFYSNKKYGFF